MVNAKSTKKKIRQTKADVVFDVFNTVFMVVLMSSSIPEAS